MSRENALKDYITVNERIMKFYELYPEGRIVPSIIQWNDGVVVVRTEVYRNAHDQLPSAVGHAYEKEGSSFINKTSALENCETSSVGRALALLGLEIKKSIASYEEVANAKLQQQDDDKPKIDFADEIIKIWQENGGTLDNLEEWKKDKKQFNDEQLYYILIKSIENKASKKGE
jgi:hypothetical protein